MRVPRAETAGALERPTRHPLCFTSFSCVVPASGATLHSTHLAYHTCSRQSAQRERAVSGTSEGPVPRAGTAPGAGPSEVTRSDHPGPGLSELRDYRAAFAASALPMAVVDDRGQIVRPNDALGGLFGADPASLTGRPAADLVGLGSDAPTWRAYNEVLRGARPGSGAPGGSSTPTADGRSGPRSPSYRWAIRPPEPPERAGCCCPSPMSVTGGSCGSGCAICGYTTR